MPPTRLLRPVLGVSSRLLREQCFNGIASTSSGRLAAVPAALSRIQASKSTSICPSCSFHLSRQLRFFSSSKPPPPEPPNFDHLKPEGKLLELHTNFDHLRPVEEKSPETTSSSSETDPNASIPLPPPDSSPNDTTFTTPPPDQSPNPSQDGPGPGSSLPSYAEAQRSRLSAAFNAFMDRTQNKLFLASRRVNDLTGYTEIETLKDQISRLESSLATAQETLHTLRNAYKVAVADRSSTQREVTTLLARQKTWTPADFERFTALYRTDYELETSVADRARELEEAERETERLGRELSAGILARYHEEQIWSDKIRRMSTWGTWGLMGVNILLFFMFQFGAEPWRRARLVKGFEEKVQEALEREREKEKAERIEVLQSYFGSDIPAIVTAERTTIATPTEPETQAAESVAPKVETPVVAQEISTAAEEMVQKPPISWREVSTTTTWWKDAAADLTSERRVAMRMRDVSILALEGVAAGAVMAGTIALFLFRRT